MTGEEYRVSESTPISDLELSVRSSNAFRGFETVGELLRHTETELLRIPNFGRRSLYEVKAVLAQHGFRLPDDPPLPPPDPFGAFDKRDRNRSIYEKYQNGETLQTLADQFKVTRERIRQIISRIEWRTRRAARTQPEPNQGEQPDDERCTTAKT